MAHGGLDPVQELEKNQTRLTAKQKSFEQLDSDQERMESLEMQAGYLAENVMILRNLLASDYPHVKSGMSKYKLDCLGELDESLKEFRVALKQMKATLPE